MRNDLSEMQLMMLDMIKWFHSFCQNNNIRYYVVGGTMLGAVRHNGFIPWDDDIDVGIPRKDYEKLLSEKEFLFKDENRYLLESYRDEEKDYIYPYAKIYDTQTTLMENCRAKTKRGIFIDIFPLDGIGANKESAQKNYNQILRQINFLMTRTCAIRKDRSWLKNAAIVMSRLIPSAIVSNQKLMHKIDEMCKKRDYETCEYVGNLMGNWGMKEIMPRAFIGKPTLYQFEDMEVFGPEDYDKYLANVYGDWRKMPPVEKQRSHHDYLLLDLHKSYLE